MYSKFKIGGVMYIYLDGYNIYVSSRKIIVVSMHGGFVVIKIMIVAPVDMVETHSLSSFRMIDSIIEIINYDNSAIPYR